MARHARHVDYDFDDEKQPQYTKKKDVEKKKEKKIRTALRTKNIYELVHIND